MRTAFDEERLCSQVRQLASFKQLAFAAACCERLSACYRKFSEDVGWGNYKALREALDLVWKAALCQERPEQSNVKLLIGQCEAAAPDSEDYTSLFTSSAQDFVFAVCSLLDFCGDGELEKLVLAARYPTDSADLLIQENESMSSNDPQLEVKILHHRMMQQELGRQARDLDLLMSTEAQQGLAQFREVAARESILD